MREDDLPLGIGPDGEPWPVHATASPDYGEGAILGLVAGASMSADGVVLDPARAGLGALAALTESLMRRGMLDAEDLRTRYAAAPAAPGEAVLRAVPIGLFHAGDRDGLVAAVRAECELTGARPLDALAAATVGVAVSAGTHDLARGYDMTLAAAQALDALDAPGDAEVAEAREQLRADLRFAVAAEQPALDPGADLDDTSRAMRLAFWQLIHADDLQAAVAAVAAKGDRLAAALTGALLGAAGGREAVPAAWSLALATAAERLLAILGPDEVE